MIGSGKVTDRSCKNILGYLFLLISVIMLGKSLLLCFSRDIWYDELFTVGMIGHSCSELIEFTARDVHPPLYYVITKAVVDLCKLIWPAAETIVIAKTVSVLPYFILLLYGVTFLRRRFGIFPGGLFLFCTVAMPQLSGYTVEMRMYSWALLFVTAAFLHGYGMVYAPAGAEGDGRNGNGRKIGAKSLRGKVSARKLHGAAMACYGLAAAYTQYFAAVAAAMVYLYVLAALLCRDRRRIREWILWAAAAAFGYAAWLAVLYRQVTAVSANYWILPLSWRTFGGCVKFLMKPAFFDNTLSTVLAVVMSVLYAGVLLSQTVCRTVRTADGASGRGERGQRERMLFLLAGAGVTAGVVLFGFAASMLIRPIFVYRYMIPSLGCFWLSFALGLDGMWNGGKAKRGIAAAALLLVTIVGLRDYRAFMGEEEYKILLMEQTEEALAAIAPEDIVICNFDQVQAVTSWYLPEETGSYLWCGEPESLIQDIVRPYDVVEETGQIRAWCEEGRTVWFIGSFNSRDAIVEEWAQDGLLAEETGSYLLERYWFNLYRIHIGRP